MSIKQFVPGGVDPSYYSMNSTWVYYQPDSCHGIVQLFTLTNSPKEIVPFMWH